VNNENVAAIRLTPFFAKGGEDTLTIAAETYLFPYSFTFAVVPRALALSFKLGWTDVHSTMAFLHFPLFIFSTGDQGHRTGL